MTTISSDLILRAEEAGLRLEVINGLTVWETFPSARHQKSVYRIQQSIHQIEHSIRPSADDTACGCYHYSDIYIQFPDGSLKRPDISIFCHDDIEQDEAVTSIPAAVIEIVSRGYEAKDMDLAPRFYLAQGVKDVIIFDPSTLQVLHHRRDGIRRLLSPVMLRLECQCEVEV